MVNSERRSGEGSWRSEMGKGLGGLRWGWVGRLRWGWLERGRAGWRGGERNRWGGGGGRGRGRMRKKLIAGCGNST